MGYGKEARVRDILSDATARGIVARYLPAIANSPVIEHMGFLPIRAVIEQGSAAPSDPAALERMWHELAVLEGSSPSQAETPVIEPAPDYETTDVRRSSARVSAVGPAEQWGVTELIIEGPSHGNPFVDVELSAEFTSETARHISVGGFYDGDGIYRIRFQAPSAGTWTYITASTARSLDGLRDAFQVRPPGPGNHGPVSVADRFHFAYRDGTRFLPAGTTAYAWTHQPAALEERTLTALAHSPFRKLRMCVFPKSYVFNTNEPARYPFARDSKAEWDFTRFDPEFFRHLEMRIDQLAELGIQADLILFHPYDRWGFSAMPKAADDRYIQYLVRRLGAHRSVWWSMANEYDLLPSKTTGDWERLAGVVRTNDHVGHLTSIHNCHGFYDHARPWITHCSIQRIDAYRTSENTSEWREEYAKPVVIDECGYEGDIDQGWGNISGQEIVRRCWEGAVRGGYVGHGETYLNDREELWWSKGGALVGDSAERIGFLLQITAEAPGGMLEPLPSDWDVRWGGTGDYRIAYFGFGRPRYRDVTTPPDSQWLVDVIDTWNMTIERQPGVFTGTFRIDLPGREFMAVRLTARSLQPHGGRVVYSKWSAAMISPADDFAGAPLLRTEFALAQGHGAVLSAELTVSSLGVFEAYLNGRAVGHDVLSPGWSSYEWRLRYRAYEVKHLLRAVTVLGISLGNGWSRGRLGWNGSRALYGDRLGVIAQLEVVFADGHRQLVRTDETWQAGPSATLANDLYDGQTIDARQADDMWMQPGAAPSAWGRVETLEFDTSRLTPYIGPPIIRHEALRPVAIWSSPSGRTLVDFGQNMVGWLRFTVRGEAGTEITVRHAEVLEHGELGVRPLRSARATDRFVLSGGDDHFEPTKTYHGFRYAEITGWPAELAPADLEAVVVHSDLRRTGYFACSDPMLNQLHANVTWGMRGNFLDVPTDCPQRDERLGWTGDIAVFGPSAMFLYDVDAFLRDWLSDLAAEQQAGDGVVPLVIPDALKYETHASSLPDPESTAIWSDAAAWVPWALWQAFGDRTVLEDQYASMTAHARRVESLLSPAGLWDTGHQLGDWLDPQAPPGEPFKAKADSHVVATACFYRTACTVADCAEILGRADDARHFRLVAERVRAAFNQHYVQENGTVQSDCATVYALAIVFGLLDDLMTAHAGARLSALVKESGYRISTGFAGTPYVTDALTKTGHLDDAYRLLLEQGCPSWLYPVTMGATTVWERWDSMLPDGTINPGQMTSFNHYALGAVADWIHRTIGGIAPLEPGYATVLIAPQPGGGLTWATAKLETAHGLVEVHWRETEQDLTVQAAVPAGVTGVLRLPGEPDRELASGGHSITVPVHSRRKSGELQ